LKIIHKIKKTLNGRFRPKFTYNQDGLATVHNAGFMQDADFAKAEKAGAATGSWSKIHWRVHTVLWAARHSIDIEGDFVECGTNKGGFARPIVEYIDLYKSGKKLYLLDTFKGLSENLLSDKEKATGKKDHFVNVYAYCYSSFDGLKKHYQEYDY
jgi:hypothetical protein